MVRHVKGSLWPVAMISSPPPPPVLASVSPLCSRKTYRFRNDSYTNCWSINYSALVARGEVCEDYRIPAANSETSIPSAWFLTAHSYTYWRSCYAHPEIRGKCFGHPQRSDNGEVMPAFPCPLTGPISTYPRRGTVNGAIIAGAGKEMPLNLSGTAEVRPVQLFVRYPYLRYFNLVRTAASADSEQPFSGMSVQGRTGTEDTGPSRFQTVLIGLDKEDARLIIGVSSVAHNFVLRRIGTRFFGMGGEGASYLCNRKPGGCQQSDMDTSGIRLFTADSAAEIHSGRWLSSAGSVIIRGDHPGCIEARPGWNGICEYDGKLSFVRMASAGSVVWHVFARANLKASGGRFVTVANASSAQGPYGAFQRIQIDGYDEGGPGNIYFAAVDNNPLDTETMLGLFPVNLGNEEEGGNGNGESFIALSLSCDGVHWSNLTRLVWSVGMFGRTWDHPVDGVVLHGDNVYFMVTRHSNPRHARACRTADCVACPPATLLTLLNLLVAGA